MPSIAPSLRSAEPAFDELRKIKLDRPLTMKRIYQACSAGEPEKRKTHTSPVIDEANASIKPANAASTLGVMVATKPVTPKIQAEKTLKRMESQRFTTIDLSQRGLDQTLG